MSPATLPAGWSGILDEVHMRLDQAIAAADVRIEQMTHVETDTLRRARDQEIAKWSERLERLHAYLESAEQVVQSVDETLQKEETRLRQQVATSENLRQKMAA